MVVAVAAAENLAETAVLIAGKQYCSIPHVKYCMHARTRTVTGQSHALFVVHVSCKSVHVLARLHVLYCWVILTPPPFCSYPCRWIVPASWQTLELIVPLGRNQGNTGMHVVMYHLSAGNREHNTKSWKSGEIPATARENESRPVFTSVYIRWGECSAHCCWSGIYRACKADTSPRLYQPAVGRR